MKSKSRIGRVLLAVAVIVGGHSLTEVKASASEVPSQSCNFIAANFSAASFTQGNTSVTLGSDNGSRVCYRLDSSTVHLGGAVGYYWRNWVVPSVPTIDANTSACTEVLRSGVVGEPDDPAYTPYRVAVGKDSANTFVCVDLGDHHARLLLGHGVPEAEPFIEEDPPDFRPSRFVPPTGLPSTSCGGATILWMNDSVTVAGSDMMSMQTWLELWQESPTRVHVCAATRGGPVSAGGVLTVDTTNTGVAVPITTGTDTVGCTRNVVRDDQSGVMITRSPDGADLVSVCATAGGAVARVSFDTSPDVTPPAVTWTPDNP